MNLPLRNHKNHSHEIKAIIEGSGEHRHLHPQAYFAKDSDRFDRDFVREEQLRKAERLENDRKKIQFRKNLHVRLQAQKKEQEVRAIVEEQFKKQRREEMAKFGLRKEYLPSYDPIRHRLEGEHAQHYRELEEKQMARHLARAQRLVEKGGTKFNPINGSVQLDKVERQVPRQLLSQYNRHKQAYRSLQTIRLPPLSLTQLSQR